MSWPGFDPGPPAWEASTLEKSHLDSLSAGYSEPLLSRHLLTTFGPLQCIFFSCKFFPNFLSSKSWIWIRIRKTGYGLFFILITPTLLLQRYEGDICPVITYVTIVTLWTAVTCFNILQRCAPRLILINNSEHTAQRRRHVVLMPIRIWIRLSILMPFLIQILRYPSIAVHNLENKIFFTSFHSSASIQFFYLSRQRHRCHIF